MPAGAERRPAPGEAGYVLERQTGFVLRKVHQRASEIFFRVMAEFEVTPQQFSTLVKLDDVGEASQNQLGRLVAMDPATTRGVVDRLKQRRLVRVRPDPAHGRRRLVGLTGAGRALAAAMRERAHRVTAEILAPLSGPERQRLSQLLAKLE